MSLSQSAVVPGAAERSPRRAPDSPAVGRRRRPRNLAPLWLLTPAGLVVLAVTIAPIVFMVFISFTDYDQRSLFTGAFSGVGFAQYATIFTDPGFWWALVRTVVFTSALVAGSVVIGMGVSQLLIHLHSAMRYMVTIVLILAWGMPTVASSLVWDWLFQPGYGVINWILSQLRVFGNLTGTNWGQNPPLAFVCIWLLVVWGAVPFIALTLYAAQTQVPAEYFEAAKMDGASEWRIYRSITVPFLKPTLLLVTILSIIWDFNVFNQIWLISQGGPNNATSTLGVWTYTTAFVSFNLGEGAAISVVTTCALVLLTAVYIRNLIRLGKEL